MQLIVFVPDIKGVENDKNKVKTGGVTYSLPHLSLLLLPSLSLHLHIRNVATVVAPITASELRMPCLVPAACPLLSTLPALREQKQCDRQ